MSTAQDIQAAIVKEYGYYPSSFYNGLVYGGRTMTLPGLGEVEKVDYEVNNDIDSYGYNSGSAWLIFKAAGRTFKIEGYLDSYGDPDWDGRPYEVEEQTETITRTVWSRV